jgi:glycine/D-amino acid oxidase-like deaminating enzyme
LKLPGKALSLWKYTSISTVFPPLKGDASFDVAVLGGGIAGITSALLLKEAGLRVAVIEASRIAGGVSGHGTAHVTSSQGFYYSELAEIFGLKAARGYAQSNCSAVEMVASQVREKRIDCDFFRAPGYFYTERYDDLDALSKEFWISRRLGLPVSLVQAAPLPFETCGAIKYADQVELHPIKYIVALAEMIPGDGSFVFEKTRALEIEEGKTCVVRTDRGEVRAKDVIVATHSPITNHGALFSKMTSLRSYVLGIEVEGEVPREMFYSAEDPTHYIRTYDGPAGQEVLVGGEDHRTGMEEDTAEHYRRLEEFARLRFDLRSVDYRWSGEDNYPFRRIPFIGRLEGESLYVATAFKGLGMTYGTLAGMILSDIILDGSSPFEQLYDPGCCHAMAWADEAARWNLEAAQIFARFGASLNLGPSEISRVDKGIFLACGPKEEGSNGSQDVARAVSPFCSHMGCQVRWNNAESTWDCPCHGSRYSSEGEVIGSPAVKDLNRFKLSDI